MTLSKRKAEVHNCVLSPAFYLIFELYIVFLKHLVKDNVNIGPSPEHSVRFFLAKKNLPSLVHSLYKTNSFLCK